MRQGILAGALAMVVVTILLVGCGGDSPTALPEGATPVDMTAVSVSSSVTSKPAPVPSTPAGEPGATPAVPEVSVTMTVLYDNSASRPGMQGDWGFSCLVEGLGKTVLFDTGADGGLLLANMQAMQVRPEDVEVVVLSHQHGDHTGGLAQVVGRNPGVSVYFPAAFSSGSLASAREAGAVLMPVTEPVTICAGLTVTEPLGSPQESGLLVKTPSGMVLLTGCAHPGVLEMVAAAVELTGEPVDAVLGGFHLMSRSPSQVETVIQGLMELGVERCGPAHCTGEAATERMAEAFGAGFISMGVGVTISF